MPTDPKQDRRKKGTRHRPTGSSPEMTAVVQFLAGVDIFARLSDSELEIIESIMREVRLSDGETLFDEGDKGDELFIIQTGRVGVMVSTETGEPVELTRLGERDFLGEMSIFQDQPRSAGCVALQASRLFSIHKSEFFALIQDYPKTAGTIMRNMLSVTASRLQNTGRFLNDMVRWGDEARKRAVTDDFTGLYNRRFWDSAVGSEFKRAVSTGDEMTVVMVDLDHFGTLNKQYGEKVCDSIILDTSKIFFDEFDSTDILTRYGGDEFAFILPGRSAENANRICNSVCERISRLDNLRCNREGITQITASMGIASYPEHADEVKKLVNYADAALYRAKEAGRNRAEVYSKG